MLGEAQFAWCLVRKDKGNDSYTTVGEPTNVSRLCRKSFPYIYTQHVLLARGLTSFQKRSI
jgi:hypothetical protein